MCKLSLLLNNRVKYLDGNSFLIYFDIYFNTEWVIHTYCTFFYYTTTVKVLEKCAVCKNQDGTRQTSFLKRLKKTPIWCFYYL